MTNEDFLELDLLAANLLVENKELTSKVKMLEEECSALRQQIQHLEAQVYNGKTY